MGYRRFVYVIVYRVGIDGQVVKPPPQKEKGKGRISTTLDFYVYKRYDTV
jgi:hypothetical protein